MFLSFKAERFADRESVAYGRKRNRSISSLAQRTRNFASQTQCPLLWVCCWLLARTLSCEKCENACPILLFFTVYIPEHGATMWVVSKVWVCKRHPMHNVAAK